MTSIPSGSEHRVRRVGKALMTVKGTREPSRPLRWADRFVGMKINHPATVCQQYVSEDRLEIRRSVWRGDAEGRQPQDIAAASIAAVATTSPTFIKILEVGCGTGEFATRLRLENPGAILIATDQSARMVEVTRERGVDAEVADVMDLPFDDASFDVVVAMWMLYHAPDLSGALAEVRRVLRPDGLFVAVTNGDQHAADLLRDAGGTRHLTQFSTENGRESLDAHFSRVGQSDMATRGIFPDHASAKAYLATFDPGLADALPMFDGEREYAGAVTIFTAG